MGDHSTEVGNKLTQLWTVSTYAKPLSLRKIQAFAQWYENEQRLQDNAQSANVLVNVTVKSASSRNNKMSHVSLMWSNKSHIKKQDANTIGIQWAVFREYG